MVTKYLKCLKQYRSGRWTVELHDELTRLARSSRSLLVHDLHLKYKLSTAQSFDTLSESSISESAALARKTFWTPIDSRFANTLATSITIEKTWHKHQALLSVIYKSRSTNFKRSPAVLNYLFDHENTEQHLPANLNSTNSLLSNANALLSSISGFEKYLLANSIDSISVVGNSPNILEKDNGELIDQADCVIRFNNTSTNKIHEKHIGKSTNILIASPGHDLEITNRINPEYTCLSGYYPYERCSNYWPALSQQKETRFLRFPNEVWSNLTTQLQAPPSAGLQCLTALSKSKCKITAFGFTLDRKNRGKEDKNHFVDSEKKSSRHNWDRESVLLQKLAANRVEFL